MGMKNRIKEFKDAKGLTTIQLARLADMPYGSVYRAMAGYQAPGPQSLVKLAKALGCTIDDLIVKEDVTHE